MKEYFSFFKIHFMLLFSLFSLSDSLSFNTLKDPAPHVTQNNQIQKDFYRERNTPFDFQGTDPELKEYLITSIHISKLIRAPHYVPEALKLYDTYKMDPILKQYLPELTTPFYSSGGENYNTQNLIDLLSLTEAYLNDYNEETDKWSHKILSNPPLIVENYGRERSDTQVNWQINHTEARKALIYQKMKKQDMVACRKIIRDHFNLFGDLRFYYNADMLVICDYYLSLVPIEKRYKEWFQLIQEYRNTGIDDYLIRNGFYMEDDKSLDPHYHQELFQFLVENFSPVLYEKNYEDDSEIIVPVLIGYISGFKSHSMFSKNDKPTKQLTDLYGQLVATCDYYSKDHPLHKDLMDLLEIQGLKKTSNKLIKSENFNKYMKMKRLNGLFEQALNDKDTQMAYMVTDSIFSAFPEEYYFNSISVPWNYKLKLAQYMYDQKDYAQSAKLFEELLSVSDQFSCFYYLRHEARFSLIKLYLNHLNNPSAAEKLIKDIYPTIIIEDFKELYNPIEKIILQQNNLNDALTKCDFFLEECPDFLLKSRILLLKAEWYKKSGLQKKEIALLKEILQTYGPLHYYDSHKVVRIGNIVLLRLNEIYKDNPIERKKILDKMGVFNGTLDRLDHYLYFY